MPYSVSETSSVLCERLRSLGAMHQLPRLTDVDTVTDLPALIQELQQLETRLTAQQQLLEWLQGDDFSGKV
ncbi:MAG: hypothetical protein RLO18_35790 [Gimesia chilikensis]